MSAAPGPANQSEPSSGSNAMGECMFGYCEPVKGAAHQITGMFNFVINGLFGGGGGDGGGHDHGHH